MSDGNSESHTSDEDQRPIGDHSSGDSQSSTDDGLRRLLPQVGIAVCFFATVIGGLLLFEEAAALGLGFDDPDEIGNVGVFAAVVLGATVVMLAAFRYDRGEDLLRVVLAGVFGWLVAMAVVLLTGVGEVVTDSTVLEGLPASPLPVAVMVLTAAVLLAYPEWWVLDLVGVVGGAAGVAVLGISFGPLPIVVLLVAWAAYDAYAVYWSGHMKELAGGALGLKLPIVFIVPRDPGFSLREGGLGGMLDGPGTADQVDGDGGDDPRSPDETARNRGFEGSVLGLGDALIPGMLAVSAAAFLDAPTVVPALSANAPALGTVGGAVVGMLALNYIVNRWEGVHAGLPPLVTCVLVGYLLGAVAGGVPVRAAVGL